MGTDHVHIVLDDCRRFAILIEGGSPEPPQWIIDFTSKVRFCPACGRLARNWFTLMFAAEFVHWDPTVETDDCLSIDQMTDLPSLTAGESAHFHRCVRCQMICHEALAITEIDAPDVIPVPVEVKADWPMEVLYTGSSGFVVSPNEPLPRVRYHLLKKAEGKDLPSLWAVIWDNRLFLILSGSQEELSPWQDRKDLALAFGDHVIPLRLDGGDFSTLLAPRGRLDDQQAIVLQCDVTVKQLTEDTFNVPGLLSEEVRLEKADAPRADLSSDLVEKNLAGRFINGIPQTVQDKAERLTLNLYLRLLLMQQRLLRQDAIKLVRLEWLAEDVQMGIKELLKGPSHESDRV